ncbi:MAG: integrase arm-type DNA-binding domain-containing protein [Rubrivivax sp.]
MAGSELLSDRAIRAALKAAAESGKARKISDGGGLLLEARPTGAGWWRWRFWRDGTEGMLSLGTYPEVSLAQARQKRDTARKDAAAGVDPSQARKTAKAERKAAAAAAALEAAGLPAADSFEAVAREWHAARRDDWSASYAEKVLARLVTDVFPYIGRRQVASITPAELLDVLRRIEARGVIETAHRAHESCSQVFRYAVGKGLVASDPARDLKGLLRKPQVRHFPAITKPERLAELLHACDGYAGTPVVRAALRLAPMLLLRPGELRQAQWAEFDLDGATWTIPAERMKREKAGKASGPPHLVPLPPQAVQVLRDLQPLTGAGPWVFRGERHHDRPMSENTVNAALRAMGFPADEVTGHGFRATARTILAERLNVPETVIEAQLAHSVRDSLGRAYNRTQFLDQRRTMMVTWADYLDRLRKGAAVVPIKAA